MGRRSHCAAVLALASLAACGGGTRLEVAEVPSGASASYLARDGAELVALLAFDPAPLKGELPPGRRFVTLDELADEDPYVRNHLAWFRSHSEHAFAVLHLRTPGALQDDRDLDEVDVAEPGALLVAAVTGERGEDSRAVGSDWLVLGAWHGDADHRARLEGLGLPVRDGRVELDHRADGVWSGAVHDAELRVVVELSPNDRERDLDAHVQSLWSPGRDGRLTAVRAFGGHVERQGAGKVDLAGPHPLVEAVSLGPPLLLEDLSVRTGYYLPSPGVARAD